MNGRPCTFLSLFDQVERVNRLAPAQPAQPRSQSRRGEGSLHERRDRGDDHRGGFGSGVGILEQ